MFKFWKDRKKKEKSPNQGVSSVSASPTNHDTINNLVLMQSFDTSESSGNSSCDGGCGCDCD